MYRIYFWTIYLRILLPWTYSDLCGAQLQGPTRHKSPNVGVDALEASALPGGTAAAV